MPLYFHNIELLIPVFMKKLILSVFTIVLSLNTVFAQVPKDSLKARYLFRGNADDVSGNNLHAIVNGTGVTLTSDRFGNPNSAYSFDGASGDISANIGELKSAISISFWYLSGGQTHPYPHFFDYSDYKLRCHIMSGSIYNSTDRNALLYEVYNPSSVEIRGSVKPGDNVWTHVVVTFNKNSNNMAIYVNGVLDKQKFVSSNDLALTDGIIIFGRNRAGIPNEDTRFTGKLDDIYIYSKELTAQEITALYNNNNVQSTNEVQKLNEATVYPNPFTDNISIIIAEEETVSYKIYDIAGKELLSGVTNSQVNVATLNQGLYTLWVYKNNELVSTQKIVKQ